MLTTGKEQNTILSGGIITTSIFFKLTLEDNLTRANLPLALEKKPRTVVYGQLSNPLPYFPQR